MPTLEVTIQVKQDGVPVAGFPLTRRVSVDELQSFEVEIPAHGSLGEGNVIPLNYQDTVQALIMTTDRALTVGLKGGTPISGIGCPGLSAGGVLCFIGADLGAGFSQNVVNNLSGATAIIKGVGAGT